jgi:AraC family transcriptional regulator, regulatory protein of adaptative response / methylated-DNA-[protein]-cysteine methyltransferase
MNQQDQSNYERIEKAIVYIKNNYKSQPTLMEIADQVHLSPYHFQRLFTKWAGMSPKKFVQFLNLEYAKSLLERNNLSLLELSHEVGLSGTGRLHDLFIKIEGMTPGEYKNGGENLTINYSYIQSPFGMLILGSTQIGICHMFFEKNKSKALKDLKKRFPRASFKECFDERQENAARIFSKDWRKINDIKLHLLASPFQIKVWQSLLKIPLGELRTYGGVAKELSMPNSSRAIGTAIGKNPIAFLIPCHRVIKSDGNSGEYMWGSNRKLSILSWEAAQVSKEKG